MADSRNERVVKPALFSMDELGGRRELPARPTPEREPPPKEPRVFYEDAHVQLWHGRWQDVVPTLGRVDAVITDPPYSSRVHDGHDNGVRTRREIRSAGGGGGVPVQRRTLSYDHWTEDDVADLCAGVLPQCPGWLVALSDSDLCAAWRRQAEAVGRTGFHPVPCVISAMTVRLAGDGPSSWAIYANVARPPALSRWGTLPGAYVGTRGNAVERHIGGKPLWLMRELVRDYSRAGNVILDPCAGAGTTGRAAKDLGRRAILIEQDRRTCELAAKVLRPARAWQQELGAHSDTEDEHG